MPPFQPQTPGPRAGAELPPSTGPSVASRIAAEHVLAPNVKATNVIQAAIVGLADERIHAADLLIPRLTERPRDD